MLFVDLLVHFESTLRNCQVHLAVAEISRLSQSVYEVCQVFPILLGPDQGGDYALTEDFGNVEARANDLLKVYENWLRMTLISNLNLESRSLRLEAQMRKLDLPVLS